MEDLMYVNSSVVEDWRVGRQNEFQDGLFVAFPPVSI